MAEYKIIVDFKGGQGDPTQGGLAEAEQKTPKVENYLINGDYQSPIVNMPQQVLKSFAGVFTLASLANAAKQIFSNEIQLIGRYTGSQQAQDEANAVMSVAGMLLRPISSTISLQYQMKNAQFEKTWESIGIQLDKERGGATLNRSRLS